MNDNKEKRKEAHKLLGKYRDYIKVAHKKFDCGGECCEKCCVCKYNNFIDWAISISPSNIPCTIEYDSFIDRYLTIVYGDLVIIGGKP